MVSSLQFLLNFSDKSLKKPHHSSLTGFFSFTFARRTALFDWRSLRLASWCCHALRLDTSATRSSVSVGGSLLHARTRLPCSHFGLSEGRFYLVDSAFAWGIHPEAVPNSVRYLLSAVRIGRQTLPIGGGFDCRNAPTITGKMAKKLDRSGHDVVIGHRVERRLVVHRYIPNELAISLPSQDVIDTFFASSKVCDTPSFGERKNVFTRERSWLVAKDNKRSPLSFISSRP